MRYEALRRRTLETIKPSAQESRRVHKMARMIEDALETAGEGSLEAVLAGSLAKGTWLKGNHDIDIFARFKDDNGRLDDRLEKIIKKVGWEYERVHGSRDYFEARVDGYVVEIIPVLAIEHHSQAKNITDMSPSHVHHIARTLSARQCDEVRLAKQFSKAQRVYGAESYIKGFSGHVLELLIAEYGTFKKLLEAAAGWGAKTIIDSSSHHKNPMRSLAGVKTRTPLVLVDPMQPDRNAAAALSQQSYDCFKQAARQFLSRPTLAAFKKKPFEKLIPKKAYTVVLEFEALAQKKDTAGTKCLKAFEHVNKSLEFEIVDKGFDYDHDRLLATAYILAGQERLPKQYDRLGPPVSNSRDAARFREKHPLARAVNGRLVASVERENHTLKTQVQAALKHDAVLRRVSGARMRELRRG